MNYNTFKQIKDLKISKPLQYKNLSLFSLKGNDFSKIKYITMQEATKKNVYKISEISEEGNVPELKFTNHSDLPILITEGTELIGLKQNRVLNTSILAPNNQTIIIPVSCCERSRWSYHSSHNFSFHDRSMYSSTRFHKVASVNESWSSYGQPNSDQSRVWDNISNKNSKFKINSHTESMGDFYDTYKIHLDEYIKVYKAEPDDLGVCAAIGNKIVLLELFDCNKTFTDNLSMIVRSLAADAMEINHYEKIPSLKEVEVFFDNFINSQFTVLGKIGMGEQVRIANRQQEGQGLLYNSSFVHCFQFNRAFFRNF